MADPNRRATLHLHAYETRHGNIPSVPTPAPTSPPATRLSVTPAEATLRRCVGELLHPTTLAAAQSVAGSLVGMPGAHQDLAIACVAAAVYNELPLRAATQPWGPRHRDPLAEVLVRIIHEVAALDPSAVEVASVLLDDGFEGSLEQLFKASAALATG